LTQILHKKILLENKINGKTGIFRGMNKKWGKNKCRKFKGRENAVNHFGQQWANISCPMQSMLVGQKSSWQDLPRYITGQLFNESCS
jgi:hypothetical protein